MKRHWGTWGLIAGLAASAAAAGDTPPALQYLIAEAREKNPEIVSARGMWRSAMAEVVPAKTWPDPTFLISFEETPAGEKMNHFQISQMIPFPGKLSREGRMKHHEARIMEGRYRAKALEILSEVRLRYYRLYLTDRWIELLGEAVLAMQGILKSAEARLASGAGQGSDVFMAQAELRRMENMLFEERQKRRLEEIELNALLNRPVDDPLGSTSAPELRDLPFSSRELQELASKNDPIYLSAVHEVDHGRAMLARARLGFLPDLGVMYDYQAAPGGMRGYEAGVNLTVPIWVQRPLFQLKQAKAHLAEAEAASRAMRSMVGRMVAMEHTETQTHLQLARNYESGVLPAAQAAARTTQSQYEAGKGDLIRALEGFRALLNARMEYHSQVYRYGEHWSLLERWVGVELVEKGESHGQ